MELPTSQNCHPLQRAIDIVGLAVMARALKVSHQAIRKWQAAGKLPRTEWTGETKYAETIEAIAGGAVTKPELLSKWPAYAPRERQGRGVRQVPCVDERALAREFARQVLQREVDRITHAATAPPGGRREHPNGLSKERSANHRERKG